MLKAITLCLLLAGPAAADDHGLIDEIGQETQVRHRFRYSPAFILQSVAGHLQVELRPEIPLPKIRLASETPIAEFQDAVARQWPGVEPEVVVNVYVADRNEIYLLDDPGYYEEMGRWIDDSLAHEFAHYLQVNYFGLKIEEFSMWHEQQAVQEQTWFRTIYLQ